LHGQYYQRILTGIFYVSGVGDITVGVQSRLFRPPTENGGNIAVNMQLKIPTGKDDATGAATLKGQTVIATADQSMQPGDGTWGFSVGTQAYKSQCGLMYAVVIPVLSDASFSLEPLLM
jgi:hypothetical protein